MHHFFDEKIDIYSCGVILYFMLVGVNPFSCFAEITVKDVLNLNKKNKIKFDKCPWVSPEAQKFIKELTNTNPYARLSATQALQSEWFTKFTRSSTLFKIRSIDESVGLNKFDTFDYGNALVGTISNCVKEEHMEPRLFDEEVKANKVPQLEAQNSMLSFEIKRNRKYTQGESGVIQRRVRKYNSGIYIKKPFVHKDSHKDHSYAHNAGMNGVSRLKKKSQFALQAGGGPVGYIQ